MIYHASIPADDPERVARVLAKIWQADYFPFVWPGSFVVIPGDEHGSTIEIMRRGDEQVPGKIEAALNANPQPPTYTEVHLLIGTRLEMEDLLVIAAGEGWIARTCDRNMFNLVEVWIENKVLIEVVPQNEAARYRAFYRDAENWREATRHMPMPLPRFGYTDEWLTAP